MQNRRQPLRVWPGVVVVAWQWLTWYVVPIVIPGNMAAGMISALGSLVGGVLVVGWWAFFSRASRAERWGAVVVVGVALAATRPMLHESTATAGMGVSLFVYALPILSLALVAGAVASRYLADAARRAIMVVTIVAACGVWTLLRVDGISGAGEVDFAWRWSETHEDRLLADTAGPIPAHVSTAGVEKTNVRWPGFRGLNRDSIVAGVRIATDWSSAPPVELWRRPVGPGWSSFAVRGDLLYTQEQRGDEEVVASYRVTTGEPVWTHRDPARFWEANGGAGPRGTPTLRDGRVYTFGGTGIVNGLDAADGTVVWSRHAASDADVEVPYWGFSSSPLVVDDIVIVAAAGTLVAYDLATGDPRWFGPAGGDGYSSPHFVTIDGVPQILLQSGAGVTSVRPDDGATLWEHSWRGLPIVQPARIAGGDLLISASASAGTRRLAVAPEPGGWTVTERWTSNRLKPYYSDLIVHEGHAFGFDGSMLACIDLEDGARTWKGGRYGAGQIVLLPDQNLLFVLSEEGDLALVEATPGRFTEVARVPALEGKTWNHPVLVGDLLLVRNAREMAAFRVPLADRRPNPAREADRRRR